MTKEEVQERIDKMFTDMLDLTATLLIPGNREAIDLVVTAMLAAFIATTCNSKLEALHLVTHVIRLLETELSNIKDLIA